MKKKSEDELDAMVLTDLARMEKGFEEQLDSMVMAEVARLKVLYEEVVAKLKETFEVENEDMIEETQMDDYRTGVTIKQQENAINELREEIEKLCSARGPLQEDQIIKLKEEIINVRAARWPLLRDLDDMQSKLILMQWLKLARKQSARFEGEDEAVVDPVEDEEALLTATEKLLAELKYEQSQLRTAEGLLRETEPTVVTERQPQVGGGEEGAEGAAGAQGLEDQGDDRE